MANIIFAMEEEEVIAPVEVAMVPQAEAELEVVNTEIQEEAGEIEELNCGVEDAATDSEVLDQIKEVLEESVENGEGVDETTAQVAEVAVESIYARLGIKKQKVMPAMESFGSSNSRLAATKIALEGMGDRIKQIMLAIKKALIAIAQRIKEFFMKFFSNTEKVKAAAKAAKEQAAGVKGSPEKEKIALSSVAKGFYNPKTKTVDIEGVFANQTKLTENFLNSVDMVNGVVALLEKQLKNPAELDKEIAAKLQAVAVKVLEGIPTTEQKTNEDGGEVAKASSGPLVGCRYVVATSSSGEKPVFKIGIDEMSADIKDVELKALSADEAGKLADEAIKLMTLTETYKTKQPKIDAVIKSLTSVVDTAITLADKLAEPKDGADAKVVAANVANVRKAVTDISTAVNRLTSLVPALNVQAAKLALNYTQASLKNIKEAKAEEQKEEKKEEEKAE